MSSLYIVESPFQLISAMEAKYAFPDDKHILFIRYSLEERNNKQINKLLSMSEWDEIIKVRLSEYQILTFIDIIYKLKKITQRKENLNNVFLSFYGPGYQRYFLANTRKNKVFLIDDGYYTLEIQRNYLSVSNPYPFKDSIIRKLILNAAGLISDAIDTVNLFTCFNVIPAQHQCVIKHEFNFLKSIMFKKNMKVDENIYLLGGNWIETDYLSKEYYLSLIRKIAQYFYPQNIVYVPHRRESSDNVNLIRSIENMQVDWFDNPVELEFILRGIVPTCIASCFSTALITLKSIHPSTKICVFKLDDSQINPLFRKRVKEFYDFSELMFESVVV